MLGKPEVKTDEPTINAKTPIVQTIPYKEEDPLVNARKEVTQKLAEAKKTTVKKEVKENTLSPVTLFALATLISNTKQNEFVNAELTKFLEDNGIDKVQLDEIAKHPDVYTGDQLPANLQSLALPPGAEKPPEFSKAPGTPGKIDARYYPTRYVTRPEDKMFEKGDLLYVVHEDSTFTILSKAQQSPEYQSAVHMPSMNLIERIGGDVKDLPSEATDSGLLKKDEKKK